MDRKRAGIAVIRQAFMDTREDLSGKRALMIAAAERIAVKQQAVIDEFDASITETMRHSETKTTQSVRDFLIEDD
jgi:hypothetical protein